jgi:lysophospholipase L1-like esterase
MLPIGAADASWVDEVTERRNIVKKLAEQYNAVFVPFQSVFDEAIKKAPDEYWLADGVHPTAAGHQLMSDAFFKAVSE